MRTFTLFLALIVFIPLSVFAQTEDWKSSLEKAEELNAQNEFYKAGKQYLKTWNKKRSKKELLQKAGDAFYNARAFEDAAMAYSKIADKNKQFALIGLKYARALKQTGQYTEAAEAFQAFADNYKGDTRELAQKVVSIDMEGCSLAENLENLSGQGESLILSPAFSFLNQPETDETSLNFLNDSTIIWRQTKGGNAFLYQSKITSEDTSSTRLLSIIPPSDNHHIGSSCLSEDGRRFYFTACSSFINELGFQQERCKIFATARIGDTWMTPVALNKYINTFESSASYPYAVTIGNEEYLYFASDRRGSKGGLDIWYTVHSVDDVQFDFSFPKNCGRTINTKGDEVTPFYNTEDSTLYFSSNGHVNMGGFDVFKSKQSHLNKWATPENLGKPVNSSRNDFFYFLTSDQTGYFVSNRGEDTSGKFRRAYDIFRFEPFESALTINGKVIDKSSKKGLAPATLLLFDITAQSRKKILQASKTSSDGHFTMQLNKSGNYKLEVRKEGYQNSILELKMDDLKNLSVVKHNFYLSKKLANDEFRNKGISQEVHVNPLIPAHSEHQKIMQALSKPKKSYKIQLGIMKQIDQNEVDLEKLNQLGRLDKEQIKEKGYSRLLLAEYQTIEEAQKIMEELKSNGSFTGAFVVEYCEGKRIRKIK